MFQKKIENFSKKSKDRKQLGRFLGCLAYASDFIKNLVKLRKSLQQKFKKEVSWIWTINDTKIVQNFKRMCKNLAVLNLPNEGDDLVFEIDVSNEHWSCLLYTSPSPRDGLLSRMPSSA